MYEVSEETLINCLKPFDVVTDEAGNVGLVQEVSVNKCQDEPQHQISYSVEWLVGRGEKSAWYSPGELTLHCNLFIKIAECACHPMGHSGRDVQMLFNKMNRTEDEP